MKVLLWKPGVYDSTRGELPTIGLGILATSIIKSGHEVVIADHHFSPPEPEDIETATIDLLYREQPDILGLSLVSHEWEMPRVQAAIDAAHRMNIPIWIGGPHAVAYGDMLEKDKRLTKIIIGEADNRFEEILNSSDKLMNFGRSPVFNRPTFTVMQDHQDLLTYPLFVSRGCHYNCTFCSAAKVFGNRWRGRELNQELWDELDEIAVNHPKCRLISVIDDAFTQDMDHAKNFLREYIRREYPYQVNVFNVRADYLDEEVLLLLKETGVRTMSVGVESGDPEVFRMMRKGETLDQVSNAIRLIQKVGMIPWINMVIGLPGDTLEAHRRSVEWVLTHEKPRIVQWNMYSPLRGTAAYEFFVKRGDFEDGFIAGFSNRYEKLPESGPFDAFDFSREEKTLAQLEAFLRCHVPIIILSDKRIRKLSKENGLWHHYEDWRQNAPIREFLEVTLPRKMAKSQASITSEEYNSVLAEFANDYEFPTDPFAYKVMNV